MGLDISYDCWHGAYSRFNRWRNDVAIAAGYALQPVEPGSGFRVVALDWDSLPEESHMGEWPETPSDPLMVLFAHSDCDGVIHPAQAGPLADRLEEILPLLSEDPHSSNRTRARQFVDGLREAVKSGEDVEFR